MRNSCNLRAIKLDSNGDGVFSYSDIPSLLIESFSWVSKAVNLLLSDSAIGKFFEVKINSCDSFFSIFVAGILIFFGILGILVIIQSLIEFIKKIIYTSLFGKGQPVPMRGSARYFYRWVTTKNNLLALRRVIFFGLLILAGYIYLTNYNSPSTSKAQNKKPSPSGVTLDTKKEISSTIYSESNKFIYAYCWANFYVPLFQH
jgi:hypothetical protein